MTEITPVAAPSTATPKTTETAGTVATATTVGGQPAVQVQSTTVPEGNLGGAGKVVTVGTPEQAKDVANVINAAGIDASKVQTGTPTETQAKNLDAVA